MPRRFVLHSVKQTDAKSGDERGLYRVGTTQEVKPSGSRDRYFDALRAAAIIRVVVFHMFPLAWISMVFPSMGVMFALGGSLMVRSIDRSVEQAITGRLRRLLPGLWVMGAVGIPAMIWAGWDDRPGWTSLMLWVLPIAEPPSSEWAGQFTGILWYLVTYLWLVLLSPVLLWCYRRARLFTLGTPLAGLAAWENLPALVGESAGSVVSDVLTFAACWVLGFAHRVGDLRRVSLAVLIPVAVAAAGGGLAWTLTHPGEDGVDLASQPVAYGVFSVGFVLLLLRFTPRMDWLARRRFLNGLVNLCNARAVTIYLWHNVAIALCFATGDFVQVWRIGDTFAMAGYFAIAVILLVVVIALLGWVEDVAARRPVRLLPWSVVPPSRPRPVTPAWSGPVWF
jgi:hypothetical protein